MTTYLIGSIVVLAVVTGIALGTRDELWFWVAAIMLCIGLAVLADRLS